MKTIEELHKELAEIDVKYRAPILEQIKKINIDSINKELSPLVGKCFKCLYDRDSDYPVYIKILESTEYGSTVINSDHISLFTIKYQSYAKYRNELFEDYDVVEEISVEEFNKEMNKLAKKMQAELQAHLIDSP